MDGGGTPKKIICEYCESEFEYKKSDLYEGAFGCLCTTCPACGKEVTTDEENPNPITAETVKFPEHFYHTSIETGAVDICNQDQIRKLAKEGIEYFRQNKSQNDWTYMSGNLYLNICRNEDDEEYNVIVSNDYYETTIPFQGLDYSL